MGVLQDKTIAITGAASGIGLASARACLAEGANVALVDRDQGALARLCAELGPRAVPVVVDLSSPVSVASMLPRILESFGHLDAFHANAGAYVAGEVWTGDPDAWDRMLQLNVNAVFRTIHAVLPHMIARGAGDIVATSSIAGHTPVMVEPVYTASKHAVTAFITALRRQALPHGVRVGQISPGPVDTALLKDWQPERLAKAKADGALLDAGAVAEALVFLLSRPKGVTVRDIIILPQAFDI